MEEISYTCPVSYHIMENYLLMRDNAPEEAKRQLDLYLELARREILDAAEFVPFIPEDISPDDTELLDQLIVAAGEGSCYDFRTFADKDVMVQEVCIDNIALFSVVCAVYSVGLLYHWCEESIPSKLRVVLNGRWDGVPQTKGFLAPFVEMVRFLKKNHCLPGFTGYEFFQLNREGK